MEPQVIAAIISGSIGAFAGISRALGNFNKKIDRKFDRIQREVDELKNSVIHDYVLKEDFLREMQGVHTKLDRILDHLLNHTN
jgi:phage-related protein